MDVDEAPKEQPVDDEADAEKLAQLNQGEDAHDDEEEDDADKGDKAEEEEEEEKDEEEKAALEQAPPMDEDQDKVEQIQDGEANIDADGDQDGAEAGQPPPSGQPDEGQGAKNVATKPSKNDPNQKKDKDSTYQDQEKAAAPEEKGEGEDDDDADDAAQQQKMQPEDANSKRREGDSKEQFEKQMDVLDTKAEKAPEDKNAGDKKKKPEEEEEEKRKEDGLHRFLEDEDEEQDADMQALGQADAEQHQPLPEEEEDGEDGKGEDGDDAGGADGDDMDGEKGGEDDEDNGDEDDLDEEGGGKKDKESKKQVQMGRMKDMAADDAKKKAGEDGEGDDEDGEGADGADGANVDDATERTAGMMLGEGLKDPTAADQERAEEEVGDLADLSEDAVAQLHDQLTQFVAEWEAFSPEKQQASADLWDRFSSMTSDLSYDLCEQLRYTLLSPPPPHPPPPPPPPLCLPSISVRLTQLTLGAQAYPRADRGVPPLRRLQDRQAHQPEEDRALHRVAVQEGQDLAAPHCAHEAAVPRADLH